MRIFVYSLTTIYHIAIYHDSALALNAESWVNRGKLIFGILTLLRDCTAGELYVVVIYERDFGKLAKI